MPARISTPNRQYHSNLTGLLLGAGASYDLGMPLLSELTDELKSWLTPDKLRYLNRHWRRGGSEFAYPDDVIEDVATVLQREDMHYEAILGHLQVQSQRQSDESQSYSGLYMFLSDITYALLQERHLLNTNYIERNIRYLDGIKRLAERNNPLWIFSLNHDLIIECFAADAGIPLKSGFTEETIRLPRRSPSGTLVGHLAANVLPEDVLKRRGLPFLNTGQMGINLLKVHGSLDVFTFRDGKDALKLLPNGEGIQGVMSSLRIANQELKYLEPRWPGGAITSRNEIVFADESGEMQFLQRSLLAGAHKFDSRHHQVIPNELLLYFSSNLKYLSTLVCIGYGFGDYHINQVMRDWLESSSERNLTIVSPTATQIPNQLLHLAPQVELVESDCTDYLDQAGGIARTRFEQTARRFGAWKREKGTEADARVDAFLQEERNHYIERAVEWAKKLPMRDGDVDLEALDTTIEELTRAGIAEMAIPSPTAVLERFLREERSSRDSS